MNDITKTHVVSALIGVKAVAEAIKELKSVPSGRLYAEVQGKLSLDQYEKVIAILVRTRIITKKNNLLIWNLDE